MIYSAQLQNRRDVNQIILTTNGNAHVLNIEPRSSGYGSSVNGGELLSLAMATCFCNDIYLQAALRGVIVEHVEVEVESEFNAEGGAASAINYRARVKADASEDEIREIMLETDRLGEVQNTIRRGLQVNFVHAEAISVSHAKRAIETSKTGSDIYK